MVEISKFLINLIRELIRKFKLADSDFLITKPQALRVPALIRISIKRMQAFHRKASAVL